MSIRLPGRLSLWVLFACAGLALVQGCNCANQQVVDCTGVDCGCEGDSCSPEDSSPDASTGQTPDGSTPDAGLSCSKREDCPAQMVCQVSEIVGRCVCDPACLAKTCEQLGRSCGTASDGCCGTVDCGLCPEPTDKLECRRRRGDLLDPPAVLAPGYTPGPTGLKEDIYQRYTDGSFRLIEKCLDWQSQKANAGLNCGSEITSDNETLAFTITRRTICCPVGKVAINGLCQKVSPQGGYCYARSQCEDGLQCNDHLCMP